ncbi:MAG TPA: NRDE family protein, partial [Ignavibacteriaceae bacterium]|nr:NRDE family protein [Ignavibacteriaceae bacterium]
MCLLLVANKVHPKYKLIIAANRDEEYSRPTEKAGFWNDYPNILAGRDLKDGGTWLGISKEGKIAAVTNFRDLDKKENAPSRGMLTKNFLTGLDSPFEYSEKLKINAAEYNGFNLVFGILNEIYYFSNKNGEPQKLEKGVYGLSNCLLDTPWPKVEKGKDMIRKILNIEPLRFESILNLLQDKKPAEDKILPDTGIGLELERILSSIFVKTENFGTRCSTLIMINNHNEVDFI